METIRALIADRHSEELFLDFKRSSDNGAGTSLSQTDRNNLAKAISGFGNSAGGVIVWGIDCSRGLDGSDVAQYEVPVVDANRFKSWLEGVVSGCTFPPHDGVLHAAIEREQSTSGFVVTYVPQSIRAPHQVVGKLQYFMRAGSDFIPVPHQILAGMFGRRPQPDIVGPLLSGPVKVVGESIQCQMGLLLKNDGAGVARDIFYDVKIINGGGLNCHLQFEVADDQNWTGAFTFGRFMNMICRNEYRMPPGAMCQPLVMSVTFAPPFSEDVKIERLYGCEGAPPKKFTVYNSAESVTRVYKEFMRRYEANLLSDSDWENVAGNLLGAAED